MKGTEQYFPEVLFLMPYKVVLSLEAMNKILNASVQVKATEQYFPLVLFIMLHMMVLTLGIKS